MANLDKNTGSLQGRHMGILRSRASRLLLNRLSVEISLLLAHCEGNPNATVTGGFPSHSAESVSMSWRHHWSSQYIALWKMLNCRHFSDDIFKCIFSMKIAKFLQISLRVIPKGPINNNPASVQIMAWCRLGDKPLSESIVIWYSDAQMLHSASMS